MCDKIKFSIAIICRFIDKLTDLNLLTIEEGIQLIYVEKIMVL